MNLYHIPRDGVVETLARLLHDPRSGAVQQQSSVSNLEASGPCTNLWTYVTVALAKLYILLGHTEDVLCRKMEMATEFIHVKAHSIESLHG